MIEKRGYDASPAYDSWTERIARVPSGRPIFLAMNVHAGRFLYASVRTEYSRARFGRFPQSATRPD